MPPKKKPEAKKPTAKKSATKKPAAKKTAARKKPAAKKPAAKVQKPAAAVAGDEPGFLGALKATPGDLTAHLAYADWLDEQNRPTCAVVLRAWVEFARVPVSATGMDQVNEAYRAYQGSLLQQDADWIEAMDKVRRWISKPVAEKIVRLCIQDVYGTEPAASWAVSVTPCFFDDRWHGGYTGEQTKDGKTATRSGAFYVTQIVGSPDGHVTTV